MQKDEKQNPFLSKAKEAVCRIRYSGYSGTGFFCEIPGKIGDDHLTLLITNNHVYPKDSEITGKYIEITINEKYKKIYLEGRRKWTNSDMDFTCIEIKKEDNIKATFSLDDNILKSNYSNKDYIKQNVTAYVLNSEDKYKPYCSDGYIEEMNDFLFTHTCNTIGGCSGGCIVNQNTNLVIGIHKGALKENKFNVGIFINDVIEDIKNQVNHF